MMRGSRLGVPDSYFFRHLDPDIDALVHAALATFASLGADIVEVKIPPMIEDMFTIYRTVQTAEAFTFHARQGWLTARRSDYAPATLALIESGETVSARAYIEAQQRRQEFSAAMKQAFSQCDAVVTPTLPVPARRVDAINTPVLWDGAPEPAGEMLDLVPHST